MEVFNVREVGKFSDQKLDQPYSERAEGGYVRNRVVSNDKCSVTIACFRDGETPGEALHSHPGAIEIYYVVEGEAVGIDSQRNEQRCGPGSVVYFDAGEPHNIHSAPGSDCLVYRVQVGADRSVKRPA